MEQEEHYYIIIIFSNDITARNNRTHTSIMILEDHLDYEL